MSHPSWPRSLLRTRMFPRTRAFKISAGVLAGLLVLALVATVSVVWAVRRPFPGYGGELALPGLSAPVTVHRDGHGIPQVYAETVEDLFRAQGYLHAQDRFWEMDFRRHVTSGRLAEWFGQDQVETDAFLRTLGWRRIAEDEWGLLSPRTRGFLTAYAEGVDAWVEATGGPAATGRKALQYRLLGLRNPGYEVAPWDPVDSLAWLKAMAWDLRGNMEDEIERMALLAAGLTRDQIEELFPPYPFQEHQPIVTGGQVLDGMYQPGGTGGELPDDPNPGRAGGGSGLGSNSWVVSGEHTDTGAPILVNDPHLGVTMPGIWHQQGLHCGCGYRVSGFTFSGVPGVVIGHNDRVAWGFTNLDPDVTDLYLERVDGDRYLVDGEWRDLEVREETIRVAGGDDVTIRVRHTHHGPLISDADEDLRALAGDPAVRAELGAAGPGAGEYAFSLAWTALRPGRTAEALFVLNQAAGWDEFRQAASRFEVPAQNLIYADVDGNIGYQAPGAVPVRRSGDGRWPAPGWDSGYDWDGYRPFEELPYAYNPPSGMVITANQAVVGPSYRPPLTTDWGYGYRSDRIHDLLGEAAAAGPIGVADMQAMLFDNHNGFAPVLVPALLSAARTHPLEPDAAPDALELLEDWDFQQPAGGEPGTPQAGSAAAAAYFNAVWRHLLALTFDELPEDRQPYGGGRWFQVVTALLAEPTSPWWDRTGTEPVETRGDVLAGALSAAYRELADDQGSDPREWRWGRMHTLALRDATFGTSGIAPVEALFNRGPVRTAGGPDIVNATWWDASSGGYEVTVVPSMRMIVDMSDLGASRWVQLTGNSGHPYHPNYLDQLELWRTGEMLDWHWDRTTIEAGAADTLALTP